MNPTANWMPQVVAEPQRAAALELLWAHLEPDSRQSLHDATLADSQTYGPAYWSSLVACQLGGAVVGVAWVQPHDGRVASLHGPVVTLDDPQLAARVAKFAVEQASQLDITGIQALLPSEYTPLAAAMSAAGFQHLADLQYLFCTVAPWASQVDEALLRFRTATPAELADVIERTYRGSLDCPAVDGLRKITDILNGYRSTGVYLPELWQIVSVELGAQARDVGCLILADHPNMDQIELVYMGIFAEERGNRWGERVVRQAQRLTYRHGRKRLVLAVDAANWPALRMYAAAGFITFDRKSAWYRPMPGNTATGIVDNQRHTTSL